MAKLISIFNNKGGVGKTTICWNLADSLARRGKHVLIIDFDPQCNISIAMLGEEHFVTLLPRQNVPYGTCIRSFLQRFMQNTGGEEVFLHAGNPHIDSKVRIVAGDFWMNVYGDFLNVGNDLLSGTGIAKFVVLRKLVTEAERKYGRALDFVLIDLPPSFGTLVRSALYSSDYYVVPCTSDNFSAYCVGLIGEVLPKFVSDWNQGLARFKTSNPVFDAFDNLGQPRFAGWVFNGFDTRGGSVVRADHVHQNRLETAITDDLMAVLKENIQHYDPIADNVEGAPLIGEIEDMNVLGQNSLWQNVPISQLQHVQQIRDLRDRRSWSQDQLQLIKKLGQGFDSMAKRLIKSCT